MAVNSFYIKDKIRDHFKSNSTIYLFLGIVVVCGLLLGLYFSLTGYKYRSLLSGVDKNLFDYITGAASYSSIFYSRLINIILSFVVVFVLTLSIYTSILSLLYLAYQAALIVLSCAAIISLHGLSGVLNVLLLLLPVNIINLVVLSVFCVICVRRAKDQKDYKLKFFESFREQTFLIDAGICMAVAFVLCLIYSFILPLLLKSFVVVNY